MLPVSRYLVDPNDPRMPSQEAWNAMSDSERARIVASLPTEFPVSEAAPPEGDLHYEGGALVRDVLRRYFRRGGRRVYVANELPVFYPGESMFSPDVMVVNDVDARPRMSWAVSVEGKGLDMVIEIHVAGRRAKDLRTNVVRYARLGIREYFVLEVLKSRITAFRLAVDRAGSYQPVLPQGGLYPSEVLGLDVGVEGERLRFFHNLALLPESAELIARMEAAMDQAARGQDAAERQAEEAERRAEEESRRAEEESRRAEEESRRAKEESRRADESEQKLAEALAELARLKGEKPTP